MILVLDTATRRPVVALADDDGMVLAERTWESKHHRGEELLGRLDEAMAEIGARPHDITSIVVGTGPGSFTGLRIGLATAKTIAYAMSIPVVGVSSTRALALAAATANPALGEVTVALPAGAADRYVHRFQMSAGLPVETGQPELVATPAAAEELDGEQVSGLATALARLGAAALSAGESADPQTLVPAYVALPRGIAAAATEMTWSPDLR
ncbi:MAG: tRNA (adenosine(37)-N6)-threonylcarbamoyltransferase complex dimerization subunit type 1 TsaB [Chloroflexota bacterium]